ncbi:MAG: VOC family protein [Deltaproteobacteria bacterium]|nr:VOC family protein [Deltaproteobacteria bacterium]
MDATWHHVAMSVKDMTRTLAFYRDQLGFEVEWERDHYSGPYFSKVVGLPDADARVVMLTGYGTRIELFQYYNPETEPVAAKKQNQTGITHFALTVKNIKPLYERLSAAGVIFHCPPQNVRPGVWATYMKDPEGATIELVEYE